MKLQRAISKKLMCVLAREFARKKGPSSVLIKTNLKEKELFTYGSEAYNTPEPFFPEFIATLGLTEFLEFFGKHRQEFSNLSWILSYKRVLELEKEHKDDQILEAHYQIENHIFQSLVHIKVKDLNILAKVEAENNKYHKELIAFFESNSTPIDSDPSLLAYFMRHSDTSSNLFECTNTQFKNEYINDGTLLLTDTELLVAFLRIYCIKLQNISITELLEKQLVEFKENMALNEAFKIVKIYSENVIKQPNESLLESCFYQLAENIESFDISILYKLYEYLLALNVEDEHFMIYITKQYLNLVSSNAYPKDFDMPNKTAFVLFTLHKLNVS